MYNDWISIYIFNCLMSARRAFFVFINIYEYFLSIYMDNDCISVIIRSRIMSRPDLITESGIIYYMYIWMMIVFISIYG